MKKYAGPLAFTVVFTLGAFELFLRLAWPQENMHLYEVKNDLIFNRAGFADVTAMRPYASLTQLRRFLGLKNEWDQDGAPVLKPFVVINSQGFREERPRIPREKTRMRRLINLGGSIGFGWPYPLEQTYLKRIEASRPDVETLNCSIIAANSPQLAKIYDRLCAGFDHDWVLMQVTLAPNAGVPDYLTIDFWGAEYRIHQSLWWTRRRALASPALTDRPLPRLVPPVEWTPETRRDIEDAYRPRLPLYDELHMVRFIENVFWLTPLRAANAPVIEAVMTLQKQPWYPEIVRQLFEAGDHPTLQAIEAVRARAAGRGARTLVMIFPNRYDLESGHAFSRPDVRWLMEALKKRGIPFIEPAAWFPGGAEGNYLPHDEHPTPRGYARMAEVIMTKIDALDSKERVNKR